MDPKLTFDQQLDWLNQHGISIKGDEEEKIKYYLKFKSYFYKMISFVKSFNSSDNIVLITDFDMLADLSVLDMELRCCLLKTCLDIEHATKTFLMRIITNDSSEDGYNIVSKVIGNDDHPDNFKQKLFSSVSYRDSHGRLIIKHSYEAFYENPPIWLILEISSLGKLRSFVEFLSQERPNNKDLSQLRASFKYINKLRNKCSHNRILITQDIQSRSQKGMPHVIYSTLRNDGLTRSEILTPLLLQIGLALRIHQSICSKESHSYPIDDLENWYNRTQKHVEVYQAGIFVKFFEHVNKLRRIYQ